METGVVVIQESVSATIIEGANDYLLSVHADGTVKNDNIEEPPGIGDHLIKAPEVKIVPDESNNGVTINEDKFSGSVEAREVPNESGNTENDGSERVEKTEQEKETDVIVETPEITMEAEKETGNSGFPLGKQVSNFVEATSVRNEETAVHESDVVSIAESLNREDDGDDDKAQPVETISMKNDEEIILDAATTDSNQEEEMSRKIEEIHESSKAIDDAASTENKTVQEELPIIGNSPIHEEMAESSDASTSTPPENMKRELVRSCKESEMEENSNQAHEESRRRTYKDIEEHVTEETVQKDTTIVTESEDVDCTTAPEKEGLKNAMAQEEIPRNDVPIINEIEGIETTTAEEEHITKNAETILNATEVVHSATAAEKKITKDTELLDGGEATKDCHLEPEENQSKKEMLQKEGEDTAENEIKAAQTTALAEQEIPRNVMPIVNETEAVDITTAEEEISKNAGMILDETEAVHSGIAAEEKIAKDTVLLDEGEAIKEGHPEQQENLTTKEMLQKQGEETTGNETEAVQTITLAGNDILTNVVPVDNETEAVDTTTAKEKEISTNAETVLHATEAIHYGISAEEKIPKDTELLDEGKATKEGHLEPEENLTKKEMLQKEGEETNEKESEAVQTTALAEEEIPRNAVPMVNETEAVDTTTAEEEKISKNAETFLDATEAVHSVLAAEEKIAKDTELLDEGETTKEGHLEPEENLIKKEVLQKEGGETTENESEAVQTTTSAEEEIPKNAVPVVNETEAVDSTAAEEEKISKNAETVLDATEVVHSAITAEEKSDKVTELLDEGETTKGHLGPEESPVKKEMLQKEDEETIKNDSENVQTIASAEEEIPRNAVPVVNETESVDTTTAEDQKASKNAEQVLDATEAVDSAIVAEETIAKDIELFNEGEATKEGHLKPEENQTKREMLQREGEETTENKNEAVQTTASPEEEIPRNGVPVVNETAVDSTTAEEENASKNAETVLDATEVVHCAAGAEENTAKASGLLGEREAAKDGHLEEEENPNKKQMLQNEGEETTENEDETAQTTASAEEKIQRSFVPLVNETIAVDSTTAEKEEISKNSETVLDVTEAVHTTTATEGNIAKDAVFLDEGGITEEGHLEHVTKENLKEMLQKDSEENIANKSGLVQTTAAAEEEFPTTADNAVNETKAIDTRTEEEEEEEEEISKSDDTDVDAIDAAPSTIAAEERTSKDAELVDEGDTTKEGNLEPVENPSKDSMEEMLDREGEETKEDKEPWQHKEEEKEEGESDAIKAVMFSEEVKSSDVSEYTESSSSGIKDQALEREESSEVNSKNLPHVPHRESQEKPDEKSQESQGSGEESEVTTESEVVTEKSGGENEVGEKLLEKSTTNPDGKITQEEEPETIQVAKEEGLELEESPSGISVKVQTEDHDSENKKKLIEESQKIDEVEETDIAPELFIPSKDQNTEEADRTGESQIIAEQRGLTPDDLEMEKTDQNKARSGASDETTHDQTLPEVEPIGKMEKTSLEFPSEGLEQTTETVDEAIEEKPEEAEIPDQEGQEESSSAVKTKAETHSPLGSKELGERAEEERSVDDPIPPQEESHLPKEQVDETELQKEQSEKHESPKEEIIDDQEIIIVEKKSDELLIIPSTLPSEEQEHETLAESEKIEDKKVKEAETGVDRIQEVRETTETPELNSVSSLTAEMLEPDETTSSELVSGLDEQVPKQVEEILEEEIKETDGIKAEKVPCSEDIAQEISEKQALASALVSKEENQVNTSDGATIKEAKGEDEVLERNESQTEVPDAAETEETVFAEEKQHGDPRPLKSDECTDDKTQLQEKLLNFPSEEKPKEDEERHQLLEPLSKDTVAVDRGLPLEELRMPNEESKASDEQIQIPPDAGDNEMREGSHSTKVKEATADQSLLEEKQHEESALAIKQEETPTEETKETEKTMELIQAKDFEAPKIDDAEEAKSQKVTETIEEQEAQADHCFPVEIPHGETTPRESSNDKTPSSVLASGEEEQATAYDAETMQERKSDDEVTKGNEGEETGPAAVELEDIIGNKETTESGQETKEKLECSGVEEGTGTPAAQSHIDDKSDDKIETQSYTLTLEKEIEKPSTVATKIDDEDTKKTNTEGTEMLEVHGISKTSENVCLNQEDFKELGTPKQGGMTEDQTPLKGESPDDASYSNKTGEVEHGVDPSSTLSDSQTEIEIQTTLDTERDIRDAPSLVETITMEPAEQIQNVGEPDLESNEKKIESSGKPEDIETESPVSENTGSKADEKQDIKEAEDTSTAEAKQESLLQRNESRETETLQARNDVEEQSLPANEVDFPKKHTEVVEIQEEHTREDQASVETKILEEQTREIVERQEEIPAGEKIQISSSVLSSEEPEHALSTDKPEDKTGEFEIPKNEIQESSGPSDLIEIISDQNTPEERKEEEEEDNRTIEKAHHDANAAGVEKACLQEEHPRDPNASIESAEGEKFDIIEGNKNEEIQDEKPEIPFATRQKEEAFVPGDKADHGDANERGVTHDLKSPEVEKKEPQSALGNEEDINNVVSSEKQIIQPTELGEKPDDAVSESTEETVDSGINGKQGGEETEETSVAETENEEQSQQEQSKEADISTAHKSTNYLDLPTEQAPIDQIEEVKMHEEQPRELEAQIGEILAEQPLKKDEHVEQEEISAREKTKETSLSEEKGPQDVVKHEVDCGLNSQRTEVVEEPRQLSSSLAPEDNKRENIDTEPEVEEKAKDNSENVEKKSISEASDVSLTEPTVMSKEATPKDGPTLAPDNVMKIQALEMIERDEIRQNEVAGKENNDTSEKPDQVSQQEVKTQVYKDNEQTNVSTAVTGDFPKEEKLSGGKEEITAETSFEEPMLLPESLPAKADNVLAEKETAQGNLDDRKDTDEKTKNIKPEAQKFESVSSGSLLQDACSKIEEQETEIVQMEGCPSQPKEIAEEVQKVEKIIPNIIDKDIPVEDTLPQKKIAEDSQKNKGEADESENIKGSPSEVKEIEHVEKETNNLDEQVTKSPTSRESERNSLSDLLQKVKEVKKPTTGEEGMQVEEAKADKDEDTKVSHVEEAKTDEHKDEHKEDKTSPDSVVMVEARDVNDKTPHKKSHNILSGVGSKVKNSISKVKKAITGKSSQTKPVSPN